MNPEQILAAMVAVYAGCPTYRDSGRVVTRFIGSGERRPRTVVKPFQTAYVRPDRFRFEYRHRYGEADEWDRHIVWAHGADVRTWWDITPGVTESESLGMALAGATGVSGGSARVIPSLLLPDWNGVWPSLLTEVSSIGDETIDSVSCYRLTGRFTPRRADPAEEQEHRERVIRVTGRPPERAEHAPLTLWIDRGTLLLRRVEEQKRFETFRTEEVTSYEPAVGVPITDNELRFDPPGEDAADPTAAPTGSMGTLTDDSRAPRRPGGCILVRPEAL